MHVVGKPYNDLMAEDYYKTLGVSRSASQDEIRKAYFELARKFHPDKNPERDAKKKFQKIQAAFDVLNDSQKREMYDRYGSSFETMGSGGPRGPGRGGPRQAAVLRAARKASRTSTSASSSAISSAPKAGLI